MRRVSKTFFYPIHSDSNCGRKKHLVRSYGPVEKHNPNSWDRKSAFSTASGSPILSPIGNCLFISTFWTAEELALSKDLKTWFELECVYPTNLLACVAVGCEVSLNLHRNNGQTQNCHSEKSSPPYVDST